MIGLYSELYSDNYAESEIHHLFFQHLMALMINLRLENLKSTRTKDASLLT